MPSRYELFRRDSPPIAAGLAAEADAVLLIVVACIFAAMSVGIWGVFLRPVPRQSLGGIIMEKALKPAGTYWQYPTGTARGFWAPSAIPIAECYVFQVKVDGLPEAVHYALNTIASEQFQVGQRVRITYQERGIPPLWKRAYVLEMLPEP